MGYNSNDTGEGAFKLGWWYKVFLFAKNHLILLNTPRADFYLCVYPWSVSCGFSHMYNACSERLSITRQKYRSLV